MKTTSILKRLSAHPFVLLALAVPALAQTYSIDWSTIDDGGGTSSGGAYSVSGTIGQPDAGQQAGGSYTLSGGFWAIQTEGVPFLTVNRSGVSLVLKWPFPSTGFVLQQTTALASPPSAIVWTDVTFPAAVPAGSEWTVAIPSPAGNRFFRLRQP